MTKAQTTSWEPPATRPDISEGREGRTMHDLERWEQLTARIMHVGQKNNWSKSKVAKLADIPTGTFSQWFSGKYAGRLDETNKKIGMWLDNLAETQSVTRSVKDGPGFIKTRTANEVINTFQFAHAMSDLTAITLEAGLGKTETSRYFCEIEPHAYRIVMRPHVKNPHGMLMEMASALGVVEHNPAKLDRSIGDWINRKGVPVLFIIDEAQFLIDQAIEQLRYFSDEYQAGIVLLGNSEIYEKIQPNRNHSYAQARSRFGKGLKRRHPYPEDITALISAWKISDADCVKYLTGIGQKPGALRNIQKTMALASILAAGDNSEVALNHIRSAWSNRQMGDQA